MIIGKRIIDIGLEKVKTFAPCLWKQQSHAVVLQVRKNHGVLRISEGMVEAKQNLFTHFVGRSLLITMVYCVHLLVSCWQVGKLRNLLECGLRSTAPLRWWYLGCQSWAAFLVSATSANQLWRTSSRKHVFSFLMTSMTLNLITYDNNDIRCKFGSDTQSLHLWFLCKTSCQRCSSLPCPSPAFSNAARPIRLSVTSPTVRTRPQRLLRIDSIRDQWDWNPWCNSLWLNNIRVAKNVLKKRVFFLQSHKF